MDKAEFALKLKQARLKSGYTQNAVAEKICRPQPTVGAWEVGRSQPDMDTLEKLLRLYGISANDFFNFNDSVFKASADEQLHIKKYRVLAQEWKDAVDGVLDIGYREYEKQQDAKRAYTLQKERGAMEVAREPDPEVLTEIIPFRRSMQPASAGTGAYLGPEEFEIIRVRANELTARKSVFGIPVQGNSMEPVYHDGDILIVEGDRDIRPGEVGVFTIDGEGYVKELGDGVLISLNPDYSNVPMNESIICNGKVIGILDPEWIVK